MDKFLYRITNTDKEAIQESPSSERQKKLNLGYCILFSVTVTWAMTVYSLSSTPDFGLLLSAAIATILTIVYFFIISAPSESPLFSLLLKGSVSLLLGFVISTPIETNFFETEIEDHHKSIHTQEISDLNSQIQSLKDSSEIDSLQKRITVKKKEFKGKKRYLLKDYAALQTIRKTNSSVQTASLVFQAIITGILLFPLLFSFFQKTPNYNTILETRNQHTLELTQQKLREELSHMFPSNQSEEEENTPPKDNQ